MDRPNQGQSTHDRPSHDRPSHDRPTHVRPTQDRPNVVIIVSDDQGYGDLSCMGATDFRTPRLDALAASGARFTSFCVNSPVCSPSRASLLTGRYPGNAGVRNILMAYRDTPGLADNVPTLARALKDEGYYTGLVGKWHLGVAEGSRPGDRGFDEWFGHLGGAFDFYSHLIWSAANREVVVNGKKGIGFLMHDLWENGEEVWRDGEYSTEMFGERAVQFVRQAARREQPFFLYLGFNAPHHPMHAPNKYKERFPNLPWDRQIMAAMISAMDDQIGDVMDEIERQGARDNTIVLFLSDNGPSRQSRNWLDGSLDWYYGGTSGAFTGHKFSLFEGGIRVPAMISWPARIPAGQVIDGLALGMDAFPTILNAVGGDASRYDFDGQDILPMLADGAPSPHANEDVFWEIGVQTAVRRGPWKLVLNGLLIDDLPQRDPVHLSNLETDLGERHNLAAEHPELVADMRAAAERWRAGIEDVWEREHAPRMAGENPFAVTDSSGLKVYNNPNNPAIGDT
ncbi:MAG: sulfatase-like hydrolase/transferase [Chloroflexi bacterium]|nr:sulfatase-like hydrolase/transferase [Chloroflexota bacterium]